MRPSYIHPYSFFLFPSHAFAMFQWVRVILENPILRTNWSQESPRPLLRFKDSLEGHRELRKVLCSKLVYYSKRPWIETSKSKRCIDWSPREKQVHISDCPLTAELYRQYVVLPETIMWQQVWGIATRKAHSSLGA